MSISTTSGIYYVNEPASDSPATPDVWTLKDEGVDDPKGGLRFWETMKKYWIWFLILFVVIVLAIVGGVLLIVLLNRHKENESKDGGLKNGRN